MIIIVCSWRECKNFTWSTCVSTTPVSPPSQNWRGNLPSEISSRFPSITITVTPHHHQHHHAVIDYVIIAFHSKRDKVRSSWICLRSWSCLCNVFQDMNSCWKYVPFFTIINVIPFMSKIGAVIIRTIDWKDYHRILSRTLHLSTLTIKIYRYSVGSQITINTIFITLNHHIHLWSHICNCYYREH